MFLIDIKMAWRNIWRNPRRTLLTILAVGFACLLLVFMLSFQFGSYATMIDSSVKIHTGHLQIQAEGYQEDPGIRKAIAKPERISSLLDTLHQIAAYSFRAETHALVSSERRSYGALVVGVDPEQEFRVSSLESLITTGRYFDPQNDNDGLAPVLVGRLLARNLQIEPGDELTLLGQGRDGSIGATVLRVSGIYSSGMDEFDRSVVHIPLQVFQDVFSMGRAVHRIVILARSLGQVSGLEAALERELPKDLESAKLQVLTWDELQPGLKQAISLDLISGAIFYLILILVVAFSIMNTFLMAVFERFREFGVMLAIGVKPGRISRLVLTESVFLALIGVSSGIMAGCLVTMFFQSHGIRLGGTEELLQQFGISGRIYPQLSLLSAGLGPLLVLGITMITALYPALKVRKLRPGVLAVK
ncbi:MAG: ABC transporter permease [Desulfohalobiaceae bacterium]|nr:ABC transporter permease [Desulfohalobiaceae bacterium]